jgi:uncharacterized protein
MAVCEIWRYPVKSLGGQRVEASWADARGLLGDRAWAVLDADGKLGSGKNTRRFRRITGLLDLSARYEKEPAPGHLHPPVVTASGGKYPIATGAADALLQRLTGRPQLRVRRDTGASHFDEVPFTLIGSATIGWLQEQLPQLTVDARRLRPNVVVRTAEPFAEESWVGRAVRIGTGSEALTVTFDRVLQRCVMVGMKQPGLAESGQVLQRIAERPRLPLRLAIGGHITGAGTIRSGDPVTVI